MPAPVLQCKQCYSNCLSPGRDEISAMQGASCSRTCPWAYLNSSLVVPNIHEPHRSFFHPGRFFPISVSRKYPVLHMLRIKVALAWLYKNQGRKRNQVKKARCKSTGNLMPAIHQARLPFRVINFNARHSGTTLVGAVCSGPIYVPVDHLKGWFFMLPSNGMTCKSIWKLA